MWVTSLLRACFRRFQPASPDAASALTQSRPSSGDEDVPLRYKTRAALSASARLDGTLLGAKEGSGTHGATDDFTPLQRAFHPIDLPEGMPQRPSALLMPDALDVRSPTDEVQRTPLPMTPLTLSSPSLPSGSPTLHILRTPMPFGSPVPYPHSADQTASQEIDTAPGKAGVDQSMQPLQRGIPCLPYTLPFELRQLGQRTAGSSLAPISNPDTGQHSASQMQPKTPFAERSSAVQVQSGEDETVTPAPFKFKVSSQGQGRTPRVSGIENPATSYKENKAVMLRHTPFAERVDKAVANENAFRASLGGHKRSGLGKAS